MVPWRGLELKGGHNPMHPGVLSIGTIYWQIRTEPHLLTPPSNAMKRWWHQKSHSKTWVLRSPGQSWHSLLVAGNFIWRWKTKCQLSLHTWRHLCKVVKDVKHEFMHVCLSTRGKKPVFDFSGKKQKEKTHIWEKCSVEKCRWKLPCATSRKTQQWTQLWFITVTILYLAGATVCVHVCTFWNDVPPPL